MSGLSSHHIAQNIFAELLPYRRRFPDPILIGQEEAEVAAIQIPRLQAFIEQGETITCVLPAFPTKSPNRTRCWAPCRTWRSGLPQLSQSPLPAHPAALRARHADPHLLGWPRVR
jgi:hypothetical protein